jgi:hypothetical protein
MPAALAFLYQGGAAFFVRADKNDFVLQEHLDIPAKQRFNV